MTHRYVCSVLEDMRDCCRTKNFSYLEGLIEEAQCLVNRMEAKLYEVKDVKNWGERYTDIKRRFKEAEAKAFATEAKARRLKKEVAKLEGEEENDEEQELSLLSCLQEID